MSDETVSGREVRSPEPDQAEPDQAGSGRAVAGQAVPEHAAPEHAEPEHAEPEHAAPEHAEPGRPAPPGFFETAAERARELLLYAPVGAARLAREELERAIEVGRGIVDLEINNARWTGKFSIDFAAREVRHRLADLAGLFGRGRDRAGVEEAADSAADSAGPGPPAPGGPERDVAGERAQGALYRSGDTASPGGNGAEPYSGPAAGELAVPGYDSLAASQVVQRLEGLDTPQLEAIADYERAHRARRTVLAKIDQLRTGGSP